MVTKKNNGGIQRIADWAGVSWPRLLVFISILVTYAIVILILIWVDSVGWVAFKESEISGVQDIFITAPAVAFYIVVALCALAGWARGPAMFGELGFGKNLRRQLQKQNLSSSTIQNQIRGGTLSVEKGTPLGQTLHDSLVARLRIIPVLDQGKKVDGVITMYDIMKRVDEELKRQSNTLLDNLYVGDLDPKKPITCNPNDNFYTVFEKMAANRFTKLIVQNDDGTLVGTLDLFDIVTDLLYEKAEGT